MQIAMVHGYFLNGTGSNLLVQNLCREFCKMGHDVRLFCQESDGYQFDFIEKVYDFDVKNTIPTLVHQKETPYRGKCFLFRPNLNSFLPVFVYDRYTGYRVKPFINCTQKELENYLNANKNAFNNGLEIDELDIIISNHTIMQPVYIARSSYNRQRSIHVMIMHGSCLNFAVRKSKLLQTYAEEGIFDVDKIIFISNYSKEEFISFFDWEKNRILKKAVIIPGGVDLNQFQPLNNCEEKKIKITNTLKKLTQERSSSVANSFEVINRTKDSTIKKLSDIDFEKDEVVIYFGKYLWTKGIHLLIAAAPIIMQKSRNVRFLFVGFGSSLSYFEAMINALHNRNRVEFIHLIKHPVQLGYEVDQTTVSYFDSLIKRLEEPSFADDYFSTAENKIKKAIVIVGYLGHEHLNTLIACSELMVAPSIFPEAFGLVGIEALASGIIPVQTDQSGFSEVVNVCQTEFVDELGHLNLKELQLDDHLVENLGLNISALLGYYRTLSPAKKQVIRKKAHQICVDHYSWEIIAKQYLKMLND